MSRNVQDLVNEVISKIDQNNRLTVTTTDILQAINRGYDDMVDIVATRQEDMLLTASILQSTDVRTDSDSNRYILVPEDCYQFRVISIDARDNADSDWFPTTLINAQEAYNFEWIQLIPVNYRQIAYYFLGRKIVLLPSESVDEIDAFRMRYVRRPLPLVLPQGQITAWNSTNGTITVDALGSDLSTLVQDPGNFIHIIDGQTGEVKSTHQILSTTGTTQLTIRATPTRTSYLEFTVSGTISTDIELDDYICLASGTCVPFLDSPLTRTVIDFATNEIELKLGTGDKALGMQLVSRAETKVRDLTANRPKRARVKLSAPWGKRGSI